MLDLLRLKFYFLIKRRQKSFAMSFEAGTEILFFFVCLNMETIFLFNFNGLWHRKKLCKFIFCLLHSTSLTTALSVDNQNDYQ